MSDHRDIVLGLIAAVAAAIAAAAMSAAFGAEPAEHSIPWFQARPAEMNRALRACQDDYRLARTPQCENAQAAAARGMGRPLLGKRSRDPLAPMLDDPAFWSTNPYARAQAERGCRERLPGDAMYLRYCGRLPPRGAQRGS